MKKYHSHIGQTVFLDEIDLASIIKKIMVEDSVKPKCKTIQENIQGYFSQLK